MAKTVSAGFVELLGRLALTDQQEFTASTRATGIKDFLAANLTMAERALTIGSYRRGTLIRPERDIDILAPLSYSTYKSSYDNDSRGLLYYVRDKLKAGYSTTRVSSRRSPSSSISPSSALTSYPRSSAAEAATSSQMGRAAGRRPIPTTTPASSARLTTPSTTG